MKFTLHAAGVAGGLAVAAILSSDALMGQGAPFYGSRAMKATTRCSTF